VKDGGRPAEKAFVRTVQGDIPPRLLGRTSCHDHLVVKRVDGVELPDRFVIDDYEKSALELERFKSYGGGCVLDAQPFGAGRDAEMLACLSRTTGVHIVASTGVHKCFFYRDDFWSYRASTEELAALFVSEIQEGAYAYDGGLPLLRRSDVRAGVIKTATGKDGLDDYYKKVFRAAAIAHRRTGAPVLTHTELSAFGVQQARFLIGHGVRPSSIIISHMDRVIDTPANVALAGLGVYLDYDTIARTGYHSDEEEIRHIRTMVDEGFGDRIVLGMDSTRDRLASYGGSPGLGYLMTGFPEKLKENGVCQRTVDRMLVENPHTALAFKPGEDYGD
jgi:predicted metal-dependent phosphotriesterase family hydrolase